MGPRGGFYVNAIYNNRPALVDFIQHNPSGFGAMYTSERPKWRRFAQQNGYKELAEMLRR